MKLKLEQLVGSSAALNNLCNAEIPVSISFKLGRLVKEINEYLASFDETRNKLVQKHGKQQEDGTYKIAKKESAIVEKELTDLLSTEVEINVEPISVSALGEISVKPIDMANLNWLVVE